MKALIINGSPKNNGSTNLSLNQINEGLKSNNIKSTFINISDYKINYCTGCEYCKLHYKCIQDDDMKFIINEIIESEFIIIGTPSYWGYVTGQLKVLFDRSTPICNTNEKGTLVPKGKFGYSLSLRAGSNKNENIEIIKAINHYFSHLEIIPLGSTTIEKVNNINDLKNNKEVLNELYNIGKNLINMRQNIM